MFPTSKILREDLISKKFIASFDEVSGCENGFAEFDDYYDPIPWLRLRLLAS